MKGQCDYFTQIFMQSPSFRVHSFETMFLKSSIVILIKMFLFTGHVKVPLISCKRLVYHIQIGYYLVKWIITCMAGHTTWHIPILVAIAVQKLQYQLKPIARITKEKFGVFVDHDILLFSQYVSYVCFFYYTHG